MSRRWRNTVCRASLIAGLALAAAGCSGGVPIPTPVTLFTYAADGVSLLATGKTVGDHALSAAMEQDCVMSRAFRGRLVCHDEDDRSDEERYQALAAVYGPYSPLTSPFDLTPVDSVASVGEYEGVTVPRQPERQIATSRPNLPILSASANSAEVGFRTPAPPLN